MNCSVTERCPFEFLNIVNIHKKPQINYCLNLLKQCIKSLSLTQEYSTKNLVL